MRELLSVLVFLLPWNGPKIKLLNLLGHQIHPGARIGICLVHRVGRFEMAEGALIGHFNVLRDLAVVRMDRGAQLMMFNMVLGDSSIGIDGEDQTGWRTLHMLPYSHVMGHHYLDCGGGLVLGENSWITGIRTTILTHGFEPHDGSIAVEPVRLGTRAVIATSCTLLPGSYVGEGTLIAAGSTLWTRQQTEDGFLYGGVPARRLAAVKIPEDSYDRGKFDV